MARYLYAATPADYVVNSSTGLPVPGAVVTVWTARTGGSQVTDLQNLSLQAITQVTADSQGFIAFYGPDNTTDNLWLYAGSGSRLLCRVVNDAALEGTVLPLSGGTLTGNLTLAGAPSANLHAATKKYVDDNVINFVAKTGDTMTGSLRVSQASAKVTGDASTYVFARRQGDGTGYGFHLGATSTNPFTATLYDSGGNALSAALNYSTSSTRWNITGNTYIAGTLQTTGGMAAALAMGSNKITGLAAATTNGDAVRYEQVGKYTSYTVTVTASSHPTGYTSSVKYSRTGDLVHMEGTITIPSATKGLGVYEFSLPLASARSAGMVIGVASGVKGADSPVGRWAILWSASKFGVYAFDGSQLGHTNITSDYTVFIDLMYRTEV